MAAASPGVENRSRECDAGDTSGPPLGPVRVHDLGVAPVPRRAERDAGRFDSWRKCCTDDDEKTPPDQAIPFLSAVILLRLAAAATT